MQWQLCVGLDENNKLAERQPETMTLCFLFQNSKKVFVYSKKGGIYKMSQTVFISSFTGVQFLSTQWREQLHMNHEKMKKTHCLSDGKG